MKVIIIAGGKGERFWPFSRLNKPKQLLPIIGDKSMLEDTIDRVAGMVDLDDIFISTREDLVSPIKEIVSDFNSDNFIVEPMPRDTAAAIGLASIYVNKRFPGEVVVILPADHIIKEKDIFQNDVEIASNIAKDSGCLITFGIIPSKPATGYGYIELGEVVNDAFDNKAFEAKSFKEKPNLETAKYYFSKGNYVWNSGMFVWTTTAILEALEKYMPQLFEGLMEIQDAIDTDKEQIVIKEVFQNLDKISIDYGVMEKADNVLCMKARFIWDDVGSWGALERLLPKDDNGNVIKSFWKGKETKDSIIVSDGDLIATIGVKNLIIVKSGNAVLVMDKSKEQEVKKIVELIRDDENLAKDFFEN